MCTVPAPSPPPPINLKQLTATRASTAPLEMIRGLGLTVAPPAAGAGKVQEGM